MPIRIEVVEKEAFAAWVEEAQEEYAEVETSKSQLAGVQDLTSTRR
jgi:heme/copper-type cytochrome/quinol oxidase subunit 2